VLVFKKRPPPMGSGMGDMGMPGGGYGGGSTDGRPPMPGTGKGIAPGPGASGGGAGKPAPGGNDRLSKPAPGGSLNPLGGDAADGATGEGEGAERFEVIKLKNAFAEEAVKLLHEVFNGPNKGPGRIRLVADSRTNSIVVVKASAADLEVIQKLLAKTIDTEGKPAK
jgi:hypothetical protein